jgi:hypothetical protein
MSKHHALVAATLSALINYGPASAAPRCAAELDTLFKTIIEAGPQTRADGALTSAFLSSRTSGCTQTEPVGFNGEATLTFYDVVTSDECGLLDKNIGAEKKVIAKKYPDTLKNLGDMQIKITGLLQHGKLTNLPQNSHYVDAPIGYGSIAAAVRSALQCLKPI